MRDELTELADQLLERNREWWLNESHARGEMRELGIPDDADAPCTTMGDLEKLARLAARQPSPSARDVALKCAEICEQEPSWLHSGTQFARRIRAYAASLGNESSPNLDPTAGLGPSDLTESVLPSLESDAASTAAPTFISGRPSPKEEAEHIRIARESSRLLQAAAKDSAAAQVPAQPGSGALSEAPHPQPAPAVDRAPEATCQHGLGAGYIAVESGACPLCLQQALARAQEERDAARLEAFERARGEEEATQRAERAEAELAKVRGKVEALQVHLTRMLVASCSCDTKTPDVQYHSKHCHYRLTSEAVEMIDKLQSALASAPSAKEGQPGEQSGEEKL